MIFVYPSTPTAFIQPLKLYSVFKGRGERSEPWAGDMCQSKSDTGPIKINGIEFWACSIRNPTPLHQAKLLLVIKIARGYKMPTTLTKNHGIIYWLHISIRGVVMLISNI